VLEAFLKTLGVGRNDPPPPVTDSDYEYGKSRYNEYLAARQNNLKDSLEISDRFDKAILALSGGSLGLSLTFIEKLVPHPFTGTLAFLLIAWMLLLSSVLFSVLALLSVQGAIQDETKALDENYRAFLTAFEAGELPPPAVQNNPSDKKRDVRKYNLFSIAALGIGLFLLCIFSALNLYGTSLILQDQAVKSSGTIPDERFNLGSTPTTRAVPSSALQANDPKLGSNAKDQYDVPVSVNSSK